jgi:hypothetical protein
LPIGILSLDPWTKMMLRLQPDSQGGWCTQETEKIRHSRPHQDFNHGRQSSVWTSLTRRH